MANENNQWWTRRSQHGRTLLFGSPDLMLNAGMEYFKAEDEATYLTRTEVNWHQGVMSLKEVVCKVPYTWQGLCLYMGCSSGYFRNMKSVFKKEIADGINVERNEDFITVMDLFAEIIFKQQFDGAQSGTLKEGLTSRYLKLADKTEVSTPEDTTFKVTLKI